MLDTEERYNYVKQLLFNRLRYLTRSSFRLHKLHATLREQTLASAYFDFSYKEFYDMFQEHFAGTKSVKTTGKKFEIVEQGFLDKKERFPYAVVSVERLIKIPSSRGRKSKLINREVQC